MDFDKDNQYQDVYRFIINNWRFNGEVPEKKDIDHVVRLITSSPDVADKYADVFTSLYVNNYLKNDINGLYLPTEKLISLRTDFSSSSEYNEETPEKGETPFSKNGDDTAWMDFRDLISYYIRCIKESDRPQFFLNVKKEGKSFYVPKTINPRWLQFLGETPIRHDIRFDPQSSPILAKILRGETVDSQIYIGYPIKAIYKDGELSRIVPLAIIPVNYLPGSYYNPHSLGTTITIDFEKAVLNEEWLTSSMLSSQEILELESTIYQNIHKDDEFKGLFDLAASLDFIRGYLQLEDINPMTLSQIIPAYCSKRSLILNTLILFDGSSTNYVRSLLRELEYIAQAPSGYLDNTSLAYVFRNPPLNPDENSKIQGAQIIPNNKEQLEAVSNALSFPISRLQGPPGTGKTQVALNMIANCINRGQSVLFTSRNHQAVNAIKEKNTGVLGNSIPMVNFCIEEDTRNAWFDYSLEEKPKLLAELQSETGAESSTKLNIALDSLMKTTIGLEDFKKLRQKVSKAHSVLMDLQRQLDNQLVLTKYHGNLESLDIAYFEKAREYCRLIQGKGALSKLRQFFKKKETLSYFLSFLTDNPKYQKIIEAKDFNCLMDDLDKIIQSYKKYIDSYNIYLELNDQLLALSFSGKDLQRIEDLENEIKEYVKDSILFNWYSNASELINDDRQVESIDCSRREFKTNYLRIIEDKERKQPIEKYWQDIRSLHKIHPAWATSLLSMHLASPILPAIFDLVIVDEASQCDPICIIPAMYRAKRFTVIGDPEQFRPIYTLTNQRDRKILESFAARKDYISKFQFTGNTAYSLLPKTSPFVMLKEHFRCAPGIADFFSKKFYNSELIIRTEVNEQLIPTCFDNKDSIQWIDVANSIENELNTAVMIVEKLRRSEYKGTIGVICPFASSAEKIRQKLSLSNIPKSEEIKVSTAYGFQGGQEDTIIFVLNYTSSLNRGRNWYVTSSENNNIYNVTVSRAKACLVIIGDRSRCKESENSILRTLAQYPIPYDDSNSKFDSVLEEKLYLALKENGIHTYCQYPVGKYSLDLAYINGDNKIDIEVDGRKYHFDSEGRRKSRDLNRDNFVSSRGWKIIRLTGSMVHNEIELCIERIKELIS